MIDSKKYYTVKEIIDLGKNKKFPYVSSNMIFKLIHEGQLMAIRSGISQRDPYVVKGKSIIKFLESHEYFKDFYLKKGNKVIHSLSVDKPK